MDVPAGHAGLLASHATDRGDDAYSFVEGQTGAGVNAVTLVLEDGAKVQATVGGGWFVAWWPGLQSVKAADVTTPAGTQTQTFDLSGAPKLPCGGTPCSGGGKSGASVGSVSGFVGGADHGATVQSFSSP